MQQKIYESILKTFEQVHFILDETTVIKIVSDSVKELLGYKTDDLIGKEIKTIVIEKDIEVLDHFLEVRMEESNQGLLHLKKNNGEKTAGFITLKKVNHKEEIEYHIILTLLEKIELSYEKMHYEKQLFRLLMDNIPDAIYFKDRKSRFIDVSKAMTKIFGVDSTDEIIGKTDFDFHKKEHAEIAYKDEQRIIKTGEPMINQVQKEIWKGEVQSYTLTTKMPIRTESGEIIGTFGISKDITEQKKLENKLAKSKNILQMLLDYSSERIYFKDTEHRFTLINKAHKEYLKLHDFEDIIGKTDFDLFPEQDVEEWHKIEKQIMETGQPVSFEGQDKLPTGETRWVLTSKAPRYDEHGNMAGIIGISRDITERKNREMELEKAKQEAEEANRAKSYFLANMSHEIRTPMNGIMGMNSLLLDSELDEEQRRYAETVQKSADALLAVINDILDFSKIEAGKLEIENITFNIRSMLDDFAKSIVYRAEQKGLEFICSAVPDVPFYSVGDPGRIRQILFNLAGNAIKFTDKGEVSVFCELMDETDSHNILKFTVKDTGIGIPAKYQKKLFHSFSQADSSTTRKYGGTGLGLAISKQLAELMGGEIGFSSIENVGTTFWFTVKLEKSDKVATFKNPRDIKGVKIMFVDDNETNREYIRKQLDYWKAKVSTISNGGEALAKLHQAADANEPFEIAILDMQMPGLDGATLGKAIKNDDKIKDIPLVMMTSIGHRGEVKQLKEIGFSAYLTKPVSPSDLFNTLTMILGNSDSIKEDPDKHEIITKFSINEQDKADYKILVVEDNPVNQNVALGMLKTIGLDASYVAENGKVAIEQLKKYDFDLVFMDMQMPVLDGLAATRQIRKKDSGVRNPDVPIVAMTANAMKGTEATCLEAGMNDYISKPIKLDQLREKLAKWIPKLSQGKDEKVASEKSDSPVNMFNRKEILENLGGSEELLNEIMTMYVDNTKENIEKLTEFLDEKNLKEAALAAHSIKGSSGNITSDVMYQSALKLEQFCKNDHLAEAQKEFENLKQNFKWFQNHKGEF